MLDGLFTTPVYWRRRGRFVNSAFPNQKNLAQKSKFIYDKQIWKQMFAEILRFKKIGKRMLQHAKNDTTNLSAINLASQEKQLPCLKILQRSIFQPSRDLIRQLIRTF